jgi:hypothetical protein
MISNPLNAFRKDSGYRKLVSHARERSCSRPLCLLWLFRFTDKGETRQCRPSSTVVVTLIRRWMC